MATWTNWSGLATAHPTQELTPHDADEVADAVVAARHQNLTVKMPGTGHSFTDIAVTDGLLLRPDSLRGIVGVDQDAMTVTALAGTPLHELNRALAAPRPLPAQHGRHRRADHRRRHLHRHPRHRRSPGLAERPGRRDWSWSPATASCSAPTPRRTPTSSTSPGSGWVRSASSRRSPCAWSRCSPSRPTRRRCAGTRPWPGSTSWRRRTTTSRCTGSRTPTGC